MVAHSGLITVMKRAARKAAPRLRRDFGEVEQLQVSRKGPADFVSMADKRAEQTIVEELRNARPDWGMLLEEGGEIAGNPDKPRWIVDPLDGTTNFLHGMPHFSISIAVEEKKPGGGTRDHPGPGLPAADRRELLGREGAGRVAPGRAAAGLGPARPRRRLIGTGIPSLRPRRSRRVGEDLRRGRAAGRGHPPLRLGRARSRLGRGGADGRLLGRRSRPLGHRRRHPAGQGGGRLRHRLSRRPTARSSGANMSPRRRPSTASCKSWSRGRCDSRPRRLRAAQLAALKRRQVSSPWSFPWQASPPATCRSCCS